MQIGTADAAGDYANKHLTVTGTGDRGFFDAQVFGAVNDDGTYVGIRFLMFEFQREHPSFCDMWAKRSDNPVHNFFL